MPNVPSTRAHVWAQLFKTHRSGIGFVYGRRFGRTTMPPICVRRAMGAPMYPRRSVRKRVTMRQQRLPRLIFADWLKRNAGFAGGGDHAAKPAPRRGITPVERFDLIPKFRCKTRLSEWERWRIAGYDKTEAYQLGRYCISSLAPVAASYSAASICPSADVSIAAKVSSVRFG